MQPVCTARYCAQELGDLADKTAVVHNETKCFERTDLPPARQLSNFPEPWEETDVRWFLGFRASEQVWLVCICHALEDRQMVDSQDSKVKAL